MDFKDQLLRLKVNAKVGRFFEIGREELGIIVIYSIVIGTFSLSIPIAVQSLVNSVAFGSFLLPILTLSLIVFVGLGLSSVLRIAQRQVVEWLSLKVFKRTTVLLGKHISNIREEALDSAYDRSYFTRYVELFSIQKNISSLIIELLECALVIGSGMIVVALYHPAFLVFDLLLIGSLYFTVKVVGRNGLTTKLEESDQKYEIVEWIQNLSRPAASLRGIHGVSLAEVRTEELAEKFISARQHHFKVLLRQHAGFLIISIIASTLLLGVGGVLVFRNQLSLGQLVAAEIILAGVLASIAKLEKIVDNYYSVLASLSKIEGLFAIPTEAETENLHTAREIKGAFELLQVNYSYSERNVLWSPIQFSIPSGSSVAITGPSGAGKSTLLELIYGLRTPTSGMIRLDGIDYRELQIKALRDQIGYAGNFQALPETLKNNILLGKNIEFDQLNSLARALALEEVISKLPEGFNTFLDGNSLPFSVGEKARLSLLRALVHQPEILLVDEVLDELDPVMRSGVLKHIFKSMKGKTLFIATHDQEVANQCDLILELPTGKSVRRQS